MPKQNPELNTVQAELAEAQEQLADARAQIESLQSAAADAEARAATAQADLAQARERSSQLEADLASVQAERDSAQAELASIRAELAEARAQLGDAALKYRDARLAAAPQVPPDLVPGADTLDEIDSQLEAAQRVVSQLREKLEEETRSSRVPVGAPPRRPPDLSGLSPSEKIKLGLQHLSQREGR